MYIPEGFGTMFPYVVVKDAERFVAFLKSAFDARELGRTQPPGLPISNARLRIGTTSFMVSSGGEGFAPQPTSFYLFVENADEAVARAVRHGGKQISQVADMPYGDRQGGVVDPCGNTWWVSTRFAETPYD